MGQPRKVPAVGSCPQSTRPPRSRCSRSQPRDCNSRGLSQPYGGAGLGVQVLGEVAGVAGDHHTMPVIKAHRDGLMTRGVPERRAERDVPVAEEVGVAVHKSRRDTGVIYWRVTDVPVVGVLASVPLVALDHDLDARKRIKVTGMVEVQVGKHDKRGVDVGRGGRRCPT